jgi:hypothetical protein
MKNRNDLIVLLDRVAESTEKICIVIDSDHARYQDWKYSEYGKEFEKDRLEVNCVLSRFKQNFRIAVDHWSASLGPPLQMFENWEKGRPAWANGFFARWEAGSEFYTIFMSWENPEDDFFLVAAKAPISEYSCLPNDYSNPWDHRWEREA